MSNPLRPAVGIEARHSKACPALRGGKCARRGCGFRAEVWSKTDGKRVRRTFPTLSAAKGWRADAAGELRRGELSARPAQLLGRAAAAWLEAAEVGVIVNRSGEPYKPSALRGYRTALEKRVLPELGRVRMSDVDRATLQRLVVRLMQAGNDPSTVRNTLIPLRAIYRDAVASGEVGINPTLGLQLPAVRGVRERIVSPTEAAALLEALVPPDRALWATALYAGLRRGELMALRRKDLDLTRGVVRVEQSWDAKTGPVAPKSRAGRRAVPLPRALHPYLADVARGSAPDHLLLGRATSVPFDPGTVRKRALRAWEAAGLLGLSLHECRHTYASMMIAAGVNVKALSSYLGHSSITITLDRYGHLMPGSEAEAAGLLDEYLARGQAGKHDSPVMGQSWGSPDPAISD